MSLLAARNWNIHLLNTSLSLSDIAYKGLALLKTTIWPFKLTGNGIICIKIFLTFLHIKKTQQYRKVAHTALTTQDPQPYTGQPVCPGISWIVSPALQVGHQWLDLDTCETKIKLSQQSVVPCIPCKHWSRGCKQCTAQRQRVFCHRFTKPKLNLVSPFYSF